MLWNEIFLDAACGETPCDSTYMKQVHSTTPLGSSVLHFAVCGGNLDSIKFLLERNLDPNMPNQYGETPLHWACKSGNVEVVELLLSLGAEPNLRDSEGNTALHWAAEYDDLEIIEILLRYGASGRMKDGRGRSPYRVAKREGATKATLKVLRHAKTHVHCKY